MMKRKLSVLSLMTASVLCLSLGLSACGESSAHTHDWSAEWNSNEGYHWHECLADGCTVSDNSGKSGYAAHTDSDGDGYCDECGYDMDSETDPPATHTHTLTHVLAKEATCTEGGNLEYWYCSECDKYFTDEEATNETTLETLTLSMIAHNYENGVCTMCGERAPSEGLAYTLSSDGTYYTVSGIGTCTDTDVVIPSEYEGLPVTAIGSSAFYYCTSLTSITIPDGVTEIGDGAFGGCISLTSITIPDGVTSIGTYAFASCASLTEIMIPDGVTEIGDGAFGGA